MKENNLFRYATSELSQDAFICWLVSHCKADIYEENSPLCECAVKFLNEMLPVDKKWKKGIDVQVKKQYKNIDILLIVDDIYIIVEDKTFTDLHDNQVNRYKKTAIQDFHVPKEKVLTVFYKTGGAKKNDEKFQKDWSRKSLIEFLKPYQISAQNPIFYDYVEYLESLPDHDYEWISMASEDNTSRYAIGDLGERPLFCMYTHPAMGEKTDSKVPWGGSRSVALAVTNSEGVPKYDGLILVNLCSFRCKDEKLLPDTLSVTDQEQNLKVLEELFSKVKGKIDVWAVWGNSIEKKVYYKQALAEMVDRFPQINWYTIGGTTQNGHPHHYQGIPKGTEMEVFDVKKYLKTFKGGK